MSTTPTTHTNGDDEVVIPDIPLNPPPLADDDPELPSHLQRPVFVISLAGPEAPGSAVDRCLWDMMFKGMKIASHGHETSSSANENIAVSPAVTWSTVYDSDHYDLSDTPPTSDVDVEASSESDGEHKAPAQEPLSLASVPNIARDTRYDPGDGAHIKLSKDITKRQAYGISVAAVSSIPTDATLRRMYPQGQKVTFVLIPDSGTNTTWITGAGHRNLTISPDSNFGDTSKDIVGDPVRPTGGAVLVEYDPPSNPATLRGRVSYLSPDTAALISHAVADIRFPDCSHWTSGAVSWRADLHIDHFRFGAAYALTENMCTLGARGILGLGPGLVQNGFFGPDAHKPMSFLNAIRSTVHGTTLAEPNASQDVRMFVNLCNCEVEGHVLKNWISFNGWPTVRELTPREAIKWSDIIPLHPSGAWDVVVTSIDFWKYEGDTNWSRMGRGLQFPEGLIVTLDTGTASSWVPANVLHFIRTTLFPTPDNIQRDIQEPGAGSVPYTVPYGETGADGVHRSLNVQSWYIEYTFRGVNGRDVTVKGPLLPFIAARNPMADESVDVREGLLFHLDDECAGGRYVFGVNFLQSMYLQYNFSPVASKCFVKLAPQWNRPELMNLHGLPPRL